MRRKSAAQQRKQKGEPSGRMVWFSTSMRTPTEPARKPATVLAMPLTPMAWWVSASRRCPGSRPISIPWMGSRADQGKVYGDH